jgi:hypothetical protein
MLLQIKICFILQKLYVSFDGDDAFLRCDSGSDCGSCSSPYFQKKRFKKHQDLKNWKIFYSQSQQFKFRYPKFRFPLAHCENFGMQCIRTENGAGAKGRRNSDNFWPGQGPQPQSKTAFDESVVVPILLRGIQLTHVQRYWCSSVKMVFSYKILLFMRPIHVCAISKCYHNHNGSHSRVAKTVELTWVVYHVAEPLYP